MAASLAMGLSARRLYADHHFVSAFPLVVEFDLSSLRGRYTSSTDFYIRNHFAAPQAPVDPSITIDGEVEYPMRLDTAALARLPEKRIGAVLECAGDPARAVSLVSDGLWSGRSWRDILSLARPKPAAQYAYLSGLDGFRRSVPVDWLMRSGLLATRLNGSPLGRNHGAPWRALFPGQYGVNSVKWLRKVTLADTPLPPVGETYLELWKSSTGGTERRPLPPVQVKSVITSPVSGAVLNAGPVKVSGLAWSGSGRVVKVGVSADGGMRWNMATLDAVPSRYDWVRWSATLNLRPGVAEIVSKASDSAGNSQPARRDPRRLDFYAYNVWDRIRCVVV